MTFILLLMMLGLALSAFFSGSETGFYRASRVRLVLDGLSGDPMARMLLWLINNPSVFVATSLVGNNVANYLLSLSCVLATQQWSTAPQPLLETTVPIAAAPIFFIYGELLPKHLFYLAPNRLLRLAGPLYVAFAVLFAPFSFLLWLFGLGIRRWLGESPENIRMRLARSELQRVLDEGGQIGVLRPAQRNLAKTIFESAAATVSDVMIRPFGHRIVDEADSWTSIIERARRYQVSTFAVRRQNRRELLGYVRVVDVQFAQAEWPRKIRMLMRFQRLESQLTALMQFHSQHAAMAQIVDDQGHTLGLLTPDRLASHPGSWE